MLRSALARGSRAAAGGGAGPAALHQPRASFAGVLGVKAAAAAAAAKLVQAAERTVEEAAQAAEAEVRALKRAAAEGGLGAAAPTAAAGTPEGARDAVPASDHGERLFAGGAEVGPEERPTSAGSPFGSESTEVNVPPLSPGGLEEGFAGGLEGKDAESGSGLHWERAQRYSDADPAEAARAPLQPSGLEAQFEDESFKKGA